METGKVKALLEYVQVIPSSDDTAKYEKMGVKECAEKYFAGMIGLIDGSTSVKISDEVFGEANYLIMENLGMKDAGLMEMYHNLNSDRATEGDEMEMLKYFIALVYLSQLRQSPLVESRLLRLNWISRLHIQHIISYISEPAQWVDEGFGGVLSLPLEEANSEKVTSTLEKVRRTPSRTPFTRTDNFSTFNSSFTDSPTSRVINSPRIREKMAMEIQKQVKQQKEEFEVYIRTEYDRVLEQCNRQEREIQRLKEEKEDLQKKAKPGCVGDCEASTRLKSLEFAYHGVKTRLENTNQTLGIYETQHQKDEEFIKDLKMQIRSLNERCEIISDQEKLIQDLKDDLKKANNAEKSVLDQMDKVERECRDVKRKLKQAERENKEMKEAQSQNEKKFDRSAVDEYKKREIELTEELDKLNEALARTKKERNEAFTQCGEAKVTIERLQSQLKELNTNNAEVEDLKAANNSLKIEMKCIFDNMKSVADQRDGLEKQYDILVNENEEIRAERDDLKAKLKAIQVDLDCVKEDFRNAQMKIGDYEKKMESLIEKNEDLRLELDEVKSEVKEHEHRRNARPTTSHHNAAKEDEMVYARSSVYVKNEEKDYLERNVNAERTAELRRRNQGLPPHMQCSYLPEIAFGSESPSSVLPRK